MAHERLDLKQKLIRVLAGGALIVGSSIVGLFYLGRVHVRFGGGVVLGVLWLIGFMLIGEAFLGARINLAGGSRSRRRR